jgi:hypothetical protein
MKEVMSQEMQNIRSMTTSLSLKSVIKVVQVSQTIWVAREVAMVPGTRWPRSFFTCSLRCLVVVALQLQRQW